MFEMFKKIIIISIFCCLLFSCGKKADPEYQMTKNIVLISRA